MSPLTLAQSTLITKARNVGTSDMAVPLTDEVCAYLCAVIVHDLGLAARFPEVPAELLPFFETWPVSNLRLEGVPFRSLVEKLFSIEPNADTYFLCLATLQKGRLKYEEILKRQQFPTLDQVGPRGLLQYGSLSPASLVALLFWRKWMFDLDNRAGQETGYVFEPILANAIGGTPIDAKKSPVKRHVGSKKGGRQVDCIKGNLAYEFKIRVTIAASGQGRWGEELAFPIDCVKSAFTPILVVLDPTENPKLTELCKAFTVVGGQTYVGDAAWAHLEEEAGPVITVLLEKYVKRTLASLVESAPDPLPPLTVRSIANGDVEFDVAGEVLRISRGGAPLDSEETPIPEGVSD